MHIADASGACSGEEQEKEEEEEKEEEKEEKSCSDNSSGPGEVVVAVAVCTPPLVALQHSTMCAVLLERPFRFILIFAGDAQVHRQLLRIPRGYKSIIPLVCRKISVFGG